ncbi:DNA mismatch repair protein MutS [Candidatus Fokinia solitaria]|uniref:DNA mismatch repair protein MutS n=1 Tax=Candidatus Fokinia solitaria TaxID=1802984 RepID=A0A2U8BRF5_9RICK|nr:DNA mismatch repair protein MutS [Candidatus Fokinia solitaria]AWD32921.1 DNA mismatch repair protein MutS [Candidatus Fokinia solitaria]
MVTPMMMQYFALKKANSEYMLFYRMGDFYELFFDDAVVAAKILNIVLTKRGKCDEIDVPMCGVPYHSSNFYIQKLLKAGYKVAICEQLETAEEAKKRGAKTLVKRDIVRVITQGTFFEEETESGVIHKYIASVHPYKYEGSDDEGFCMAVLDLGTADFSVIKGQKKDFMNYLYEFKIIELLCADKVAEKCDWMREALRLYGADNILTRRPDVLFSHSRAVEVVKDVYNLPAVSSSFDEYEIIAMGVLLEYIKFTQKEHIPQLNLPKRRDDSIFVKIDAVTRKHLEIEDSANEGSTLFSTIDYTVSCIGKRLLKMYLRTVSKELHVINTRLDGVETFLGHMKIVNDIRELLKQMPDIERVATRITAGRCTVKDLMNMRDGLNVATRIFHCIEREELSKKVRAIIEEMISFDDLLHVLNSTLNPVVLDVTEHSTFIKRGYRAPLDALYDLRNNASNRIDALRKKYVQLTGIGNLKISKSSIYGYCVDITLSQSEKLSGTMFVKKQSLTNVVRYKTAELEELETEILTVQSKIDAMEKEIFEETRLAIVKRIEYIAICVAVIGKIDVITSFAFLAKSRNYVRPTMTNDFNLLIEEGKHPVLDVLLGENCISNDCIFDENVNLQIITGANMAGKSTFLRQNALIVIMAQIGSFIPAKRGSIGLVESIMTRIGASDNITNGESTFMVEMLETARILQSASQNSLILLDEVGRGTSAKEGMAIAIAVTEYVHEQIKAKTIFATHYHELGNLENTLHKAKSYKMDVTEHNGKITFMHKISQGIATHSYALHIAKLAGMPKSLLQRASQIFLNHSSY